GFLPSEDQGQLFVQLEGAQGLSYEDMARHQQEAQRVVLADPNVQFAFSAVGIRGGAYNSGIISMKLKPRSERKLSADELIGELRPKLNAIPGIKAYIQNPPPIRLGGRLSQALYQYTLQAPDTKVLYESSQKMTEAIKGLPGFVDVASDLFISNPQVSVAIDRDKAASFGLTAQQIEDALFSAYAARQVSTIYAPTNSYQVIMQVDPKFQQNANELSMLYVRSPVSNQLIPLSAFAKFTQ